MNTETTKVEQTEKDVVCPMAIIKRKEDQLFSDFKELQAETNKSIRLFTKGMLLHDSSTGTYDVGSNKFKAERKNEHKLKTHIRKANKRNIK